jgi:putative transcriptional regulator
MVDYLKAGTMLAPAFVYSDECEVPVEVKTIEKSVLFCMSKDDFSLLIGFCEPVRNNFIHILSHINFFLISKIRMVYMSSIKEKIATFLLRKATVMHCDSVPLSLSRRQLADVFGIQKSSLIRTLNELEHDNLIFVREKEIVILDVHGLQEILKG